MHDIVAEGTGVPTAVLVGVKARKNLGSKILIAEQPHCPFLLFLSTINRGASESTFLKDFLDLGKLDNISMLISQHAFRKSQ